MRDEQDLQDLLQEIKKGSPEANLFLEQKIKPMVVWIIHQQGLSYQEEDLWQEILIKIWTKIDTCNASSMELLKSWIRSMSYNHCRNTHRSKKANVIPLDEDPLVMETAGLNNPTANLESEGFMRTVASVLNSLEKKVIEHRYMDELSIDEIARELDKPPNTISSALYRAKKKLKDHFEKLHKK